MRLRRTHMLRRLSSGAVAGLAGTAAIQGIQAAGQKYMPRQMPPIRRHPGEFMVQKVEELVPPEMREKVPKGLEKAAAQALGFGYGITFALLFAATRPKVRHLLTEGSLLGLATWAAGYLGWLPGAKLMPAITRQKPMQVFGAIGSHLMFGLATVAAYRAIGKKL